VGAQSAVITLEVLPCATNQDYDDVIDQSDFPEVKPPGLIVQCVGASHESLTSVSFWSGGADALSEIGGSSRGVIEAVRELKSIPAEVDRKLVPLEQTFINPELLEWATDDAVDEKGLVGFVFTGPPSRSFDYYGVLRAVGLPTEWPTGMLIHASGSSSTNWHVLDVFRSLEEAEPYLSEVKTLIKTQADSRGAEVVFDDEVNVFRLHALVANPDAVELERWARETPESTWRSVNSW
jgi:hypothetical protein